MIHMSEYIVRGGKLMSKMSDITNRISRIEYTFWFQEQGYASHGLNSGSRRTGTGTGPDLNLACQLTTLS